ncbi:phospholipid carrier-dependent glycosyltransferase [Chloroflexales bacterium ZM16-3]|nr:phospholipid carrier-dependent glycosyltransferase [Chloroflexales bacterium ZM16-3]
MRTPSRRAAWLAPLLIFALALAPRLWALGWGLPYVEHPDEPHYVEVVVNMVRDSNPNPQFFRHPTLVFYLLTLVTRAYGWLMVQSGEYASLQDLPSKTYAFTTSSGLYIWNRAMIGVLGALAAPVVYLLGRRMFDARVALLAGAIMALARFPVENSHFIATSAPTSVFTALMLAGAWGVARDGRWQSYILAGAATGLAAGTKYNAGLIGLGLAIAALIYVLDRRRAGEPVGALVARHGVRLIAAAAIAILAFLITNPFALLSWRRFYADVTGQSGFYSVGGGNFDGPWNFAGYAAFFWGQGLGWAGCLALIVGTPLLLRHAPRQMALLLGVALLELLLLLSYATNFVRNLLIIYPAVALLAAAAAVEVADWAAGWLRRRRADVSTEGGQSLVARRWLVVAIAALILVPQLRDTAWILNYWDKPYTLEQAADALRAQPQGMLSAVELNPVQWSGDPVVAPVKWLASHPADWYRARGYRFLVLNADKYAAQNKQAYQRVLAYGTPILSMPDRDLGLQPGPGGALIDLGEHLELMPFARRAATFGDKLALLGYELASGELRARITPLEGADARELPSGQPVQINLYWRAAQAMDTDYTLFVHVIDAAGNTVAQRDLPLRYADYPTSHWRPGELVIDRADLPLPALPAGQYRFEIGLYDAATGAGLHADGGAPVVLTTVTITP